MVRKDSSLSLVFQGLTSLFLFIILMFMGVATVTVMNMVEHVNDGHGLLTEINGVVSQVHSTVEMVQNMSYTLESNSPIHRLMSKMSSFPTDDLLGEVREWRKDFGSEMHLTLIHSCQVLKMIGEHPEWLPMISTSFIELANAFNHVPFNTLLKELDDVRGDANDVIDKLKVVFRT